MATSHNFEGTMTLTAGATAVTVNTVFNDPTLKIAGLALESAGTGATFEAKVMGLVKGVTKSTAATWTAGQRLTAGTGATATFAVAASSGVVNAIAAADATAAATTGDVILMLPAYFGV